MLYICEGLDKCGKSEYIDRLGLVTEEANELIEIGNITMTKLEWYKTIRQSSHLPKRLALHFGADDTNPFESFKSAYELSKYTDLYLDRSFISEMVYGVVYRQHSNLSLEQLATIQQVLLHCDHCILYFTRKLDSNYFNSLDIKDNFESKADAIKECNKFYRRHMTAFKKLGLNVYEITFQVKRG